MNTKNWIRTLVILGLLAWPGVETYRYYVAKQQLAQSARLHRAVSERLAYLKRIQVTPPGPAESAPTPVVNPGSASGSSAKL